MHSVHIMVQQKGEIDTTFPQADRTNNPGFCSPNQVDTQTLRKTKGPNLVNSLGKYSQIGPREVFKNCPSEARNKIQ